MADNQSDAPTKVKRRYIPSVERIEATIEAGRRHGLAVASVSHYPDGRCEIHFGGNIDATRKKKGYGWEDI
ncbi:hypothetical protein PVW46_20145 [Mameliella sp. AT18]|uniref:hypothetical protein n=1 Tax=Mameliella sp. AT18 TaxID=3028385 RepID=UPI001112D9C9|nr:hypothetical protein [Mameliella sp. AT18]MDD9732217.1 hypothetical protein [Mameliella sp. AT18]